MKNKNHVDLLKIKRNIKNREYKTLDSFFNDV